MGRTLDTGLGADRDTSAGELIEPRPETEPTLETVCFLIVKARQFDIKEAETIPDPGSNASDVQMRLVLGDAPDDPVEEELVSVICDLNVDEQVDLVTLTWLGRGDGTREVWSGLRKEALRLHNDCTASYLLGMPLLADYLESGLAQLGLSCMDLEMGHL